jgi:hypothetical protein
MVSPRATNKNNSKHLVKIIIKISIHLMQRKALMSSRVFKRTQDKQTKSKIAGINLIQLHR